MKLENPVPICLLAMAATANAVWAQVQVAPLTEGAPSQPSQKTAYHYAAPLTLALEAATEAVRVCAQQGYLVTPTVVDMDGVPQVALRFDRATIHTKESSFEKAYTVVTLGPIFDFERSGAFFNLVKTSPYAPRLATMRNVIALPGAVAFKSKNAIVGALAETRTKSAHKRGWRKSPTDFRIDYHYLHDSDFIASEHRISFNRKCATHKV
jgi:uncharacterized protein GlcG (DUF336 family)